jgi:LysM repeat protein
MSAKRIILVLVSLGATSSAQADSWCGSSYRVQRGDWLAKIARNCGVSLSALRAANPWTYNSRYIYPGQVLAMPGGYYEDEHRGGYDGHSYGCGPSWDGYWVVCRGDTLGRIARYYGVSWRYLQWNNGIPNANRIYPGQVIRP